MEEGMLQTDKNRKILFIQLKGKYAILFRNNSGLNMSVGFLQIVLIVFVILLLFGSGRISKLMSELGRGVRSFRQGMEDTSKEEPKKLAKPKKKK